MYSIDEIDDWMAMIAEAILRIMRSQAIVVQLTVQMYDIIEPGKHPILSAHISSQANPLSKSGSDSK